MGGWGDGGGRNKTYIVYYKSQFISITKKMYKEYLWFLLSLWKLFVSGGGGGVADLLIKKKKKKYVILFIAVQGNNMIMFSWKYLKKNVLCDPKKKYDH